jgi:hypothetical protein
MNQQMIMAEEIAIMSVENLDKFMHVMLGLVFFLMRFRFF